MCIIFLIGIKLNPAYLVIRFMIRFTICSFSSGLLSAINNVTATSVGSSIAFVAIGHFLRSLFVIFVILRTQIATLRATLIHQKLMPGWSQLKLALLFLLGVTVTDGITRSSRGGRLRLEKLKQLKKML